MTFYPKPYLEFVDHFCRGEYRACVEPLEELWFAERDDFHKGLLRLVVGLNQIGLGLDSGPRFLLSTARSLLRPYHPKHKGIDLVSLDAFIAQQELQLDRDPRERQRLCYTLQLDPLPPNSAR